MNEAVNDDGLIRFACESCGKKLSAGNDRIGSTSNCSRCGAQVQVPERSTRRRKEKSRDGPPQGRADAEPRLRTSPDEPVVQRVKRHNSKSGVWVVVSFIALVVVGVAGFVAGQRTATTTPQRDAAKPAPPSDAQLAKLDARIRGQEKELRDRDRMVRDLRNAIRFYEARDEAAESEEPSAPAPMPNDDAGERGDDPEPAGNEPPPIPRDKINIDKVFADLADAPEPQARVNAAKELRKADNIDRALNALLSALETDPALIVRVEVLCTISLLGNDNPEATQRVIDHPSALRALSQFVYKTEFDDLRRFATRIVILRWPSSIELREILEQTLARGGDLESYLPDQSYTGSSKTVAPWNDLPWYERWNEPRNNQLYVCQTILHNLEHSDWATSDIIDLLTGAVNRIGRGEYRVVDEKLANTCMDVLAKLDPSGEKSRKRYQGFYEAIDAALKNPEDVVHNRELLRSFQVRFDTALKRFKAKQAEEQPPPATDQ